MPAFVDHVVLVDDGSTDDTVAQARSIGDARLRIESHGDNRGVGAAITTGYQAAHDLGADVTVVMAGDGQMHPDDLAPLLAPVLSGDVDYAKGNRLRHPDVARTMPLSRLIGNVVLSAVTRYATGLDDIGDSQCGYTAIHRRVWSVIDPGAMWQRYGYPNHLLGALAASDFRIADVVVRAVYDGERSGVRIRDALVTVPRILFSVARARWSPRERALPAPGGFATIR